MLAGAVAAPVFGAPDPLWRAVENIVRTAIKHGADGGEVSVDLALALAHDAACIEVSERGPCVAAHDVEHISRRFSAPRAESRDNSGHGLGLAIPRRIVQAHGG